MPKWVLKRPHLNKAVVPFSVTFSKHRFWGAFWRPFASFWLPLALFWLPFGSRLAPFWLPFSSLLTPFGSVWVHLAPFWLPLASFWLPLAASCSLLVPFSFRLVAFWLPFDSCGSLLAPFWLGVYLPLVAFRSHPPFPRPRAGNCRRQLRSTLGPPFSPKNGFSVTRRNAGNHLGANLGAKWGRKRPKTTQGLNFMDCLPIFEKF